MSAPAAGAALELQLPAAVLRLWLDGPPDLAERLRGLAATSRGVFSTAPGLWAVAPSAGRPGVFDEAAELGRTLLAALGAEYGPGKSRGLVLPGAVAVGAGAGRLLEEPLLAEVLRRPPALAPDLLHLTTHAALGLEAGWQTRPGGQLDARSGRVVPLVVLGERVHRPPWRNPTVLTRGLRWVPRLELAASLGRRLEERAVRVAGALGVGKSRLVAEELAAHQHAAIWRTTDAQPPLLPLGTALAAERRRPVWLVYDALESAGEETWAEVLGVLAHPDLGRGVRAILIGRLGTAWPPAAAEVPELEVLAFAGEAWELLAHQLFHGLSLPPAVAERLAGAAAGNPFALEESLVHLVRERQLRQVFGSFFFSGNESDADFQPSARFRLHAEADAARSGDAVLLRLAALVGEPVPVPELRAAAAELGFPTAAGSDGGAAVAAGLAERAIGTWGEGLRVASAPVGAALAAAFDAEAAAHARRIVGELLAARSTSATELWRAWPLVAGSTEGARVALAAVRGRGGPPRAEQFAALRAELAALSERGGDPALELELLWALLPLARREGRLHELELAIQRGLGLAEERPERFVAIAAVAAELALKEGRFREAEQVLRRALTIGRDVDERRKELLVIELARVLVLIGRKGEASDLLAKTHDIAVRGRRDGIAAQCLFLLGNLAYHELEFDAARDLHERALALRRRAQLAGAVSASLAALGSVASAEGNYAAAVERYEEARAVVAADATESEESWALHGLGRALARLGDFAGAVTALRRAVQLREGRDDSGGEAIARVALAEALVRLGQLESAHAEARKAHFALALLPEGESRAEAERVLGQILLRQRQPVEAGFHFAEAERLFRLSANALALPEVLADRLEAALAAGDVEAVRRAWTALAHERGGRPQLASRAICDYQLYHAAEWLRSKRQPVDDPLPFLERAYAELMRETAFLAPGLRQRFLFQIPAHQAIVDAATRRGLGLPAG